MVNFNMKRSAMLLGAAAVVLTAGAAGYRDVTGKYMQNPAFLPAWQGALTDVANGVGEVYNGAFNLYQVFPDMPAGEYTLTVDAFYRCGNNEFAMASQAGNADLNTAFIYAAGYKQVVKGLWEGRDAAPNSTEEASAAFAAGEYTNTLTFTYEGGDLTVGISNTGCYGDEWTCFDNFKLAGPEGEVEIPNGDFSTGIQMVKDTSLEGWDPVSSEGKVKLPDVNKGGGVYRKTNASPYNFGQQVDLPAGTYRFSALTFLRYGGAGDYDGKIISCKNGWGLTDSNPSPKQWYEDNLYQEDDYVANAYLYVSYEAEKPTSISTSIDMLEENVEIVRLKGTWEICEGDYAAMPENETRGTADGTEIVPAYETKNVCTNWCDSGMERESAAAFVANPDKWRQYIEFELAAPAKVWVGLAKDANAPAQFWNPFADFKLEQYDENYNSVAGIEAVAGATEYYNLQGVRVANPQGGIFIVREGGKTYKQVIR